METKKTHRQDIRDFCKKEVEKQVEKAVMNKVVVTVAHDEYKDMSLMYKIIHTCLYIGSLYAFCELSLSLYAVVRVYMHEYQF